MPVNSSQTVKICVTVTESVFSNSGGQYSSVESKLLKTHECTDLLYMPNDLIITKYPFKENTVVITQHTNAQQYVIAQKNPKKAPHLVGLKVNTHGAD